MSKAGTREMEEEEVEEEEEGDLEEMEMFVGDANNGQVDSFDHKDRINFGTLSFSRKKAYGVFFTLLVLLGIAGAMVAIKMTLLSPCGHPSGPHYLRVLELRRPNGSEPKLETVILSGGCFWSIQMSYDRIPAVIQTTVGYTGGSVPNPSYNQVASGTTGHAESVKVVFDSSTVSFGDMLQVFFERHDPTTLNRQGNDRGTEYRSAIFYLSEKQKEVAEALKLETQKNLGKEVVTEITKATEFWPAEEYHQKYLAKHGYSDIKGDPTTVPCYA